MSKSDSIPDWIYILLTLLVVGARLIKSVFAQKTTQPQQPESTIQPVFQSENYFDENTVYSTTESSDEQSIKRIEMEIHESLIEDDTLNNREEETEFDLRKAVIYKEILSRKYE